MEIEVCRATLVTETERVKLTKAVAQQFPVRSIQWLPLLQAGQAPTPICKVQGATLGQKDTPWLFLVPDAEAGLMWVPAILLGPGMRALAKKDGYAVAHVELSAVPTVVL